MFLPRPRILTALWTMILVSAGLAVPAHADFNGKFPGKGSEAAFHNSWRVAQEAFKAEDRRDNKAAEALYRKVIQIYPYDAQAYFNLGLFLNHQKRYKEAEPYLRKSIDLQPVFQNWHQLGIALAERGRLAEADLAFDRALRLAKSKAERDDVTQNKRFLGKMKTGN